MKKQVYVETSVVSYLTARQSRDLVRAARQEVTLEWFDRRRKEFDLYISALVLQEAGQGDREAARKRLEALDGLPLLKLTDEAVVLAEALLKEGPFPAKAADDAIHLALATVSEMDFLLTWNCRHLANAELSGPAARFLRAKGYEPPVVCTPEELMGE